MLMQTQRKTLAFLIAVLLCFGSVTLVAGEKNNKKSERDSEYQSLSAKLAELQAQLRQQQEQIERLNAALAEQREILEERGTSRLAKFTTAEAPVSSNRIEAQTNGSSDPAVSQEVEQYSTKVEELGKKLENATANLGGFKFSGDFRFRLDGQLRSGNDIAPPLQNVRSRYRVRLNADKDVDSQFRFHLQLSTGPYNVGTTNDQDMAGTIAKHPVSIAEVRRRFPILPKSERDPTRINC
jgi:TolA-binding protein